LPATLENPQWVSVFFSPSLLLFFYSCPIGGGGCNIERENGTPFWAKVPIPIFIDKNVLLG